jgi:hypothetical protein
MKFGFDDRRIPELFIGLIFVVLLIIAVLLVLYLPEGNFGSENKRAVQTTSNVVLNSYNSNSFNEKDSGVGGRDLVYYRDYRKTLDRDFDYHDSWEKHDEDGSGERKYLRYSSYGEHERDETFFSNYKDAFRVHVVNRDYQGGYFKVKFAFCDHYDNCISRTVQKYVPAKEEVVFSYSDVQSERYKYHDWSYEVFPDEVDRS